MKAQFLEMAKKLVAEKELKDYFMEKIMKEIGDENCSDDTFQKLVDEIRQNYDITGDDEEKIINAVIKFHPEENMKNFYFGKTIPVVFCDIDGTLIVNGEINKKTLKLLKKMESKGELIAIWTGGDIKNHACKEVIESLGWIILSKYDFSGCQVEVVVDDLPEEKFRKEYKINADKYIQV